MKRELFIAAFFLFCAASYGQLTQRDSLNLENAKHIYGEDFISSLSEESLQNLLEDLSSLRTEAETFDEQSQEISEWFDKEFEPYEGKTYFRPPPGLVAIREEREDRIEDLLSNSGMFAEVYNHTETVEKLDKKTLKKLKESLANVQGKKKIGQLLKLPNDTIEINYMQTKDGTTSNNAVHPNLNNGIRRALMEANYRLREKGIPPITSITISATTNGNHSDKSYHYHGIALDINEINGKKLRMTKWSRSLHFNELDDSFPISEATKKLHGDDDDMRFLSRRSLELQKVMAKQELLREMMGPDINKQYKRAKGGGRIWKEDYSAKQFGDTHHNHIHYAVSF